jgi:hypothetical protein
MDQSSVALNIALLLWTTLSRALRWAAGSYIFCRADLFREVGGFSHEMFASEEIDLSKKLKRAAKQHRLKFQIISEARLVTSARKIKLYGHRTHVLFFFKAMFRPRATVTNRDKCVLWYDGRR